MFLLQYMHYTEREIWEIETLDQETYQLRLNSIHTDAVVDVVDRMTVWMPFSEFISHLLQPKNVACLYKPR